MLLSKKWRCCEVWVESRALADFTYCNDDYRNTIHIDCKEGAALRLWGIGQGGRDRIATVRSRGYCSRCVSRCSGDASGGSLPCRFDARWSRALRAIIESEKPDIVIPEVEAIATDTLAELEQERVATIIPTARATQLTMNREGIRRLAAEELGLLTSPFKFAGTFEDYSAAIREIGMPCVIKPIMSSSGKGQSVVKSEADIETSWNYAQEGGRAGKGKVIIEGFVDFDYEITLLTVRHVDGTSFCDPIGHIQVDGDYRESWQPHPMSETALKNAQHIAESVTSSLGGLGIFGVELFVKGDLVYFSEVSPRPHDTGMVTMVSQDLPQFALHARAILGLPIPAIRQLGPSASAVILVEGHSENVAFGNLENALREPDTQLRLFGKPKVAGKARAKARKVSAAVEVSL